MSTAAAKIKRESEPPFPYQGPDALRETIAAALRRVVDPELALSILDVGLVYGVVVGADSVQVLLTMTSAACPVADVIIGDVEDELDRVLPQHYTIDVQLTWEPPWTVERISPHARQFMGW